MLNAWMTKVFGASWSTTFIGAASAAVLWLQSYLSNNHTINWHDPTLLIGLAAALLGWRSKAVSATGGTTLAAGSIPDAALHQQAKVDAVESPKTDVPTQAVVGK